jgi:hypothetical protein
MSIQENFNKILLDFINDIVRVFPEYKPIIDRWWGYENSTEEQKEVVFKYCLAIIPERFFDFLYKKTSIFTDPTVNTFFLPDIDFKLLWNCPDITDLTRDTIWKYLQMILFALVKGTKENDFGDAAKLFDAINEPEFKDKLDTVLKSLESFPAKEGVVQPNPEDIHNHLSKFFNGKLGNLAKELADDTLSGLDINFENGETDMNTIMQSFLKNPAKLMNMVSSISEKLESKIKTGELDQAELMTEANSFMDNMKNIPGLENFNVQDILSKLGMGIGGAGAGPRAAPLSVSSKLKKNKLKNKKPVNLKQIEDQKQLLAGGGDFNLGVSPSLDTILKDEELIALFKKPSKK